MQKFKHMTEKKYMKKNKFKDGDKLEENLKRIHHQQVLIQCWNEMKTGQDQFNKAIFKSEEFNLDLIYDAIDSFTRAISLSFEVDAEVEAISSAHLGKVFYTGLKNNIKAKKYYLDSIIILETLKPKIFTHEKWYKLMVKHMEEI